MTGNVGGESWGTVGVLPNGRRPNPRPPGHVLLYHCKFNVLEVFDCWSNKMCHLETSSLVLGTNNGHFSVVYFIVKLIN